MKCQGEGKPGRVVIQGKGRPYRVCPECGLYQYFNWGGKVPHYLPMKAHQISKRMGNRGRYR